MHHLPVGGVPLTRDNSTPTVARSYQVTTEAVGNTDITTTTTTMTAVVFTTTTITTCNATTGCIVTASVGATQTSGYVIPQSTQASLDLGTNSYRCLYTPTEDRLAATRQRAQATAEALGLGLPSTHVPLGPTVVPKPPPVVAQPAWTTRPAKKASSSEEEDSTEKGD